MVDLILARHGATCFNEARRYQGWIDPDLSPTGLAQAERLADAVGAMGPFDRVWASDLQRAWRTAELAAPGAAVERDPRLRELSFGAFEGATWDQNLARHGPAFETWARNPETAPPGGETLAQFRDRVLAWMADLPDTGQVLVVTHGGPLRVVLGRCLALPPRWPDERIPSLVPGAVARVAWERP